VLAPNRGADFALVGLDIVAFCRQSAQRRPALPGAGRRQPGDHSSLRCSWHGEIPHFETATEVDRDYYDYRQPEDGPLIIAVGDATGHGIKAGTMVAIAKSLFIPHESWDDIRAFLATASETTKQMHLGTLYMGLAISRIKEGTLAVASAGMPPVYLYRRATRTVEEIVIRSMPLGGPGEFSNTLRSTTLKLGDTLLMMSDGLPELFNPEREILDYPRVRDLFREAAECSATGIERQLASEGKRWANGRPQDDDITLI
jgi:serine phosphatase RsbU (regulator of sigma subunit)